MNPGARSRSPISASRQTVILIPDSMAWVLGTWATEIRRWNSIKCRFVIFPANEIRRHPSLFIRTAGKADIVHCLTQSDFSMVKGLLEKGGVSGIKVISTIHHIINDQQVSANLAADRIMVVCNRYQVQILQMGVPAAKLYKIYNSADTNEFLSKDRITARKTLGLPQDGLFIGFSGKFSSDHDGRKGIDIFGKVIEMVPPELQSTVRFAITGPGWADIPHRLAVRADRMHYLSFIDRDKMPDFYNALDIYLVTARVEGGPMPVVEAMSCGIPVISTPVGMVPDFIRNDLNGMIIDHDDVPGMIAAIQRLSADARLRKQIGEQARKTIVDNLQWRITVPGMNGLYDFPVAAHPPARGKAALTDARIKKLTAGLISRDMAHWQMVFRRDKPSARRQQLGSRLFTQIRFLANRCHFWARKNGGRN